MISLLYHIGAVICVYMISMLGIYLVKKFFLRSIKDEPFKDKAIPRVEKVTHYFRLGLTLIAILWLLVLIIFVANPWGRSYERMGKIKEAEIEQVETPTKEEIVKENSEIKERLSKAKEAEAEKDNLKAMQESIKIFNQKGE